MSSNASHVYRRGAVMIQLTSSPTTRLRGISTSIRKLYNIRQHPSSTRSFSGNPVIETPTSSNNDTKPPVYNSTASRLTMSTNKHLIATSTAPTAPLSIVFTDIVNSTMLWEKDTEAMTICMQLHDDIIRELTTLHHGYEVKQNGDGFMIAFPTAVSALQFCLDLQQQLLVQEWPEEITRLGSGREEKGQDGTVLFRGLRLRMSAHWGTPVTVWNKITDRADYLGPMVNRAARFVEMTEGGQIVVSEAFLAVIQKRSKDDDDRDGGRGRNVTSESGLELEPLECFGDGAIVTNEKFEVRSLGEHYFKGIEEPVKLYFIIPEALHGRLEKWPQHKYIPGSKGNIVPGPG